MSSGDELLMRCAPHRRLRVHSRSAASMASTLGLPLDGTDATPTDFSRQMLRNATTVNTVLAAIHVTIDTQRRPALT